MPSFDVTVKTVGADKLRRVASAIKAAGNKDLERELRRGMRNSAKPLTAAARWGALRRLPVSGGLAERVASSKFGVRITGTGKRVGLRITGAGSYNLRRMDDGIIRHPVYADRAELRKDWAWVNQPVRPGWFSDAEEGKAPEVRNELVKAIDAVAVKLEAAG